MRTLRGSVAVGTAALLALTMTACAKSDGSGGSASGGSSNVTLTVSRWAGPHADASIELIKQFTKETGIQVRVDAIDGAQLKQKQTLNLQGKTGDYDVLYIPNYWYPEYIDAGYLEPMTDNLTKPDLTGADYNFADFSKISTDITSKNGVVYGLPDIMQATILVYNKDELSKSGLDVPKTWPELLAVAKYFKEHGTGIALPFRQGEAIADTLLTFAKSNGASVVTDSGALDLTNPKVVEAATYIQELSKYALEGSAGWHYDETNKAVQFDQAPIAISMTGLLSILEDPSQSKVVGKVGYAPVPYNQTQAGFMATSSYSVAADSKHKTEAFKLAAWLTSKTTEANMVKAFPGHISTRASVFDDASLAATSPWMPVVKQSMGNMVTEPGGTSGSKLIDALGAGLNGMVTSGTDPATVLKDVQSKVGDQFK